MARRAEPLIRVAGGAAGGLLAALTLGTLAAVAANATGVARLDPADLAALRFTLVQAGLSALLSVALAVPVARALARRSFPGRGVLVALMGAPFILPVIVAILGLLAIFGRGGMVNAALGALGLPGVTIYGFWGVILGNVFFNLPLAVRLILQGWLAIPAERFRLAAALGFGPREVARLIERPMLRAVAPGACLAIFLICLTSFAIALTLGGGPAATTIELSIYQAFRFDFDLGRAALLAGLQFGLCAIATLVALKLTLPEAALAGLDRPVRRWDADALALRALDAVAIGLAGLFLVLPLLAVALSGAAALPGLPAEVWTAALRSLAVALASAAICAVVALALGLARSRGVGRWLDLAGMLPLAASPLVLGTGLFILIDPVADPAALALPVTALVNALLALPFAMRALLPALQQIEATQGRLADSLDLPALARLRLVTLPRLRRPLGFTLGLAAALSMGDLGVITLFAGSDGATLPLEIYRLMGAYRMAEADGAALLLLILSLALFWIFDRGGRVNAEA
ncbi:ABC transporter permease subunit [Solirhodobacter olei]|uniref:ABC transporter permease subunit n=1 Tax=Solirhodobacter olei TaxID=2493082 RepID=UPI000FDBC769|nr:ABC transporter permease subunit [Solirhodobacter olei]